MKRVTGIGGIFFKVRDPNALRDGHRRYVGLDIQPWGERRMRTLLAAVVAVVASLAAPLQAEPPAALAPVEFLLGDWEGVGGGAPGMGAGEFSFVRDLQDRVIVRRSSAETTGPEGVPSRHDDLMILHADDAKELHADYFDSEGHVIRYAVTAKAGLEAVFLSAGTARAPSFRLTYTLAPDGTLHGKFEISAPGRPDFFAPYLAWTARRASGSAAETPSPTEE